MILQCIRFKSMFASQERKDFEMLKEALGTELGQSDLMTAEQGVIATEAALNDACCGILFYTIRAIQKTRTGNRNNLPRTSFTVSGRGSTTAKRRFISSSISSSTSIKLIFLSAASGHDGPRAAAHRDRRIKVQAKADTPYEKLRLYINIPALVCRLRRSIFR